MVSVPSNAMSLVDGGTPKRRRRVLRLLLRVALTTLVFAVCACFARSPKAGKATIFAAVSAIDATPRLAAANVEQARPPAHHWRDGSSRPVDLKAVESDLDDDDDDPLWHAAHHDAPAFRCAPAPRGASAALRREGAADPSRFAVGAGLPRGPPA